MNNLEKTSSAEDGILSQLCKITTNRFYEIQKKKLIRIQKLRK